MAAIMRDLKADNKRLEEEESAELRILRSVQQLEKESAELRLLRTGRPMATAPKDRPIRVWCPEYEGLSSMFAECQWHPDAGFCVDELRQPVLWWPK